MPHGRGGFTRGSTGPALLGKSMIDGPRAFGYGAITLYGPVSNPVPLAHGFLTAGRPVGTGAHAPTTPHAQPPTGITRARFSLIRFRSPLLTECPLLQVLRCFTSLRTPRPSRCQPMTAGGFPHSEILGSKPCRRLPEAYRGPTRPSSVLSAKASTTRPCKPHGPQATTQCQTTNHRQHQITKRSQTNTKTSLESERNQQRDTRDTPGCSLASTLQFSNHHRTHTSRPARQHMQASPRGAGHPHQAKHPAWRPGNPRTRPYHPRTPTTGTQESRIRSLPHQQPPHGHGRPTAKEANDGRRTPA